VLAQSFVSQIPFSSSIPSWRQKWTFWSGLIGNNTLLHGKSLTTRTDNCVYTGFNLIKHFNKRNVIFVSNLQIIRLFLNSCFLDFIAIFASRSCFLILRNQAESSLSIIIYQGWQMALPKMCRRLANFSQTWFCSRSQTPRVRRKENSLVVLQPRIYHILHPYYYLRAGICMYAALLLQQFSLSLIAAKYLFPNWHFILKALKQLAIILHFATWRQFYSIVSCQEIETRPLCMMSTA